MKVVWTAANCAALVFLLTSTGVAAELQTASELDLVRGRLLTDAVERQKDLVEAWEESADLARITSPRWRVESLHEESTSEDTAFTTQTLSLGMSMELRPGNAIATRRAQAELNARRSDLSMDRVKRVCDMREEILDTWRAHREFDIRAAWSTHTTGVLDELTRLVEGGELSRFDLERIRSFAVNRKRRTQLAKATSSAATARLKALSGFDADGVELASLESGTRDKELIERTLDVHPLLVSLRSSKEAGKMGVGVANRSHGSELDLRASYRQDDAPGIDAGSGYEVQASVSLPSRSLRALAVARAKAVQEANSLALARAELNVRADVSSALQKVAALEQESAETPVDYQTLREGTVRRYRAGESTLKELIDVLGALEEQELLGLELKYMYRRALLELDRATALVSAPQFSRLVMELSE